MTKDDIKHARKRIQRALTGCYKGEFRAAYLIDSIDQKVGLIMAAESNAQILAGEIKKWGENGAEYQSFAPAQDTFRYKRFKWNKN